MPETLFVRDFSAGWCPSDDSVDGRPNALLQMDNVELDQNGALQLIGGTQKLYSAYSGSAHTLFSRYINSVRYDYAACSDGAIFRNNTLFVSSGDSTNAAFGTAFNFTLVCSGNQRWKDSGSSVATLGVKPPNVAPTVSANSATYSFSNVGRLDTGWVAVAGTATGITGTGGAFEYLQCHPNASGVFVIQSYASTGAPYNCTILNSTTGGLTGTSTDDDVIVVNGYIANPFGVSLQFDVLLAAGDATGDPVSDFYSYAVTDISSQATFDALTGVFTLRMPRSQFQIYGSGLYDWSTVYGFRITINLNGAVVAPVNLWGLYLFDTYFRIKGGTGAQNGTYQYAQVNVNNTGSYLAKSILGPISNPVSIELGNIYVTVQDPTTVDAQCNEAWIFRTGGNLGGTWYRVARFPGPPFPATFFDNTGDQAALDLNITINLNLVSISAATISDKIIDLIGPIQGRWYYFTPNFMYPSDINDPDLVDASLAVRICGSASEVLMWSRPVSASVVIVGTSIDCYLLTGTFATFPDGTIDVYYQSLGVKFPPISYDAVSYGGAVYYRAADGWRMVLPTSFGTTYSSQNNQLLTAPNTDRLYKGETCYGYVPPTQPSQPGSVRFPITIVKNKLWCFVTTTGRAEVWDFVRNYWRTFNYHLGDASACCATQDNKILASYVNDKITREIDIQNNKFVDGTSMQNYNLMFTYKDNGKPRQRKDTYTFKSRCYTGNGSMGIFITDETGKLVTVSQQIIQGFSATPVECFVDLSQQFQVNLPKAYLVTLSGLTDNLTLEDWSIDYDARPVPLTFLRIYPNNFGQPAQKRIRTWPFVIDTLGNNVVFTPSIDNVGYPSTIFNSTYKKTMFHYFTSDVFGIDYGGTLWVEQPGEMEVWDTGLGAIGYGPNNVQTLPEPTMFDQVGPLEIFRFGKVVRIALRCFSSGSAIPFAVFMSDAQVWNGVFNTTPGVEDEYIVDVPKGTSGRIIRVTLGPTSFTFNRYFMKFQVAMSGGQKDTELQWITIPGLTSQLSGGI